MRHGLAGAGHVTVCRMTARTRPCSACAEGRALVQPMRLVSQHSSTLTYAPYFTASRCPPSVPLSCAQRQQRLLDMAIT